MSQNFDPEKDFAEEPVDVEDFEDNHPKVLGYLELPIKAGAHLLPLQLYVGMCLLNLFLWQQNISFAVSQTALNQGEHWRLFSALAAHSGWAHLLGNGPLFVIFGWQLRAYFGLWVFPGGALLLGAVANWLTVAYYPPDVRLLGASGVVYALVGLWVCFYMFYEIRFSLLMRFFRVMGVALILLFPTTFEPRVSYLAHFWGFALGVGAAILILLFDRKPRHYIYQEE